MKKTVIGPRVTGSNTPYMTSASSSRLRYAMQRLRNPRRLFFAIGCMLYVLSIANLVAAYRLSQDTAVRPVAFSAYKSGSLITQGDVSMKFEQLRRTSETSPGMPQLAEGYEMIIMSFWVRNRTDRPIHVLPSSDTYIKDSNGNVHYLTPVTLQNPFRAGELLPAEEIKGELSYAVPKATSLKLYVDAIWSGSTIPILL